MSDPKNGASPPFHVQLSPTAPLDTIDIPALQGLGKVELQIQPGDILAPHWHPNAGEFAYFTQGKGKVSVFGPVAEPGKPNPTNQAARFDVGPGSLVYFPQGLIHYIENAEPAEPGSRAIEFTAFFDNPNFDILFLADAVSSLPPGVVERVLGSDPT